MLSVDFLRLDIDDLSNFVALLNNAEHGLCASDCDMQMALLPHERALIALLYFFFDHVGAIVIRSFFVNVVTNALVAALECVLMSRS